MGKIGVMFIKVWCFWIIWWKRDPSELLLNVKKIFMQLPLWKTSNLSTGTITLFDIVIMISILLVRDGKDQGTNVRERAKQLVSLLQDEDRLKAEREKSLKNKERFSKSTTGIGSHSGSHIGYSSGISLFSGNFMNRTVLNPIICRVCCNVYVIINWISEHVRWYRTWIRYEISSSGNFYWQANSDRHFRRRSNNILDVWRRRTSTSIGSCYVERRGRWSGN